MARAVLKTPQKQKIGEGKAGPGRPKGLQNKTSLALKEMILKALDGAGGVSYLQQRADDNPAAFLSLIGRVLPMTVIGDKDNPVNHVIKITREIVD